MCVVYLCSPLRSSFVSAVFVFNASLNDVAPVSPMLLPVDLMRIESYSLIDIVLCVVFFVFTTQIEFNECFVFLQSITQ